MSYFELARNAAPNNRPHRNCPLTPALRTLLEATIAVGTTNSRTLAERLVCSEETVKSNFRRINQLLYTHNRAEAVLIALSQGWICFPSAEPMQESRLPYPPRR
jgi:DNA-binding NarL/FixJ family response regulator